MNNIIQNLTAHLNVNLISLTRIKKFTLIELLIVIAILVILASILMPSLVNARQKGKRFVCMSNLRQSGVALHLYNNNHQGYYPLHSHWATIMGAQGSTNFFNGLTPPEERPLNIYLNNHVRIAECPSDKGDPLVRDNETAYKGWGNSYLTNWNQNAFAVAKVTGNDKNTLPKITNWEEPGEKIIFGDWTWHGNRKLSHKKTRWHDPKNRRFNMLFAEGHVKYFNFNLTLESMLNAAPDPNRGFY